MQTYAEICRKYAITVHKICNKYAIICKKYAYAKNMQRICSPLHANPPCQLSKMGAMINHGFMDTLDRLYSHTLSKFFMNIFVQVDNTLI